MHIIIIVVPVTLSWTGFDEMLPLPLLATQIYVLSSGGLTLGITRMLLLVLVTLLGNDPDPIIHWYVTSWPVAKHVNMAFWNISTLCDDGWVVITGSVTDNKENQKTITLSNNTYLKEMK